MFMWGWFCIWVCLFEVNWLGFFSMLLGMFSLLMLCMGVVRCSICVCVVGMLRCCVSVLVR